MNTHAGDSNLSILCPVPGCPRSVKSYNSFESFRSHVYRKHHNVETNGGVDDNDDFQYEQDSEDSLQLDAARFLLPENP